MMSGIDRCEYAELSIIMQNWSKSNTKTRVITFLLFDQFSNLALANLMEPLAGGQYAVGAKRL